MNAIHSRSRNASAVLAEAERRIEAAVRRRAEQIVAERADAAARRARGEPPKTVLLRWDETIGPNLAVGAPRFPG